MDGVEPKIKTRVVPALVPCLMPSKARSSISAGVTLLVTIFSPLGCGKKAAAKVLGLTQAAIAFFNAPPGSAAGTPAPLFGADELLVAASIGVRLSVEVIVSVN